MKTNKLICCLLAMFMAVAALLPLNTFAAGKIDLDRESTLTVNYKENDSAIAGAAFNIYKVADVDEYGYLKLSKDFREYPISIDGIETDDWAKLITTFEGYILWDDIQPAATAATDKNGNAVFTAKPGVYLVMGDRHTQDGYYWTAKSSLVILPTQDIEVNDWNYDLTIIPKYDKVTTTPPKTARKVVKVWDDNGHQSQRPQEILVQLLRDGEVYDSVMLCAAINWRYHWEELDGAYNWTVVESVPSNYTVSVTQESITYIVTNTYNGNTPTDPGTPQLPNTGQLWWPVPMLAAAGMAFILIGLIRRRGAGYEE